MPGSKVCFVLEPRDPEGDVPSRRPYSNFIFSELIEMAVEGRGYRPQRSSMLAEPRLVTRDHMDHMVESDLVIADLSYGDPTVYFLVAHFISKVERANQRLVLLIDKKHHSLLELPEVPWPVQLNMDLLFRDPEKNQTDEWKRALHNARRDVYTSIRRVLDTREQEQSSQFHTAPAEPIRPDPAHYVRATTPNPDTPAPDVAKMDYSGILDSIMDDMRQKVTKNLEHGDDVTSALWDKLYSNRTP